MSELFSKLKEKYNFRSLNNVSAEWTSSEGKKVTIHPYLDGWIVHVNEMLASDNQEEIIQFLEKMVIPENDPLEAEHQS